MIIKCYVCQKEFNRCPSKVEKSEKHFCSNKCQGESKRLKIIGKKFEQLEVLELIDEKTKSGHRKYKCECSCGKIVYVPTSDLITGQSTKCRKCGPRKYVGEISGIYFGSLKSKAKKRNIPFEITQSDIWEKFLEQGRQCTYSWLELTWQDGYYGEKGTASVDRINSNIGYTKGNIQIIHKNINFMKLNHTEEYFLELCSKIANFNKKFTPILDYKKVKSSGWSWKGCGEISGSYWCNLKNGAKKRNLELSTTIEYAWNLYLQQGGVCALSGLPITFKANKTASLDRIDSSIGYIEGNVQWSHKHINNMKLNLDQNYFIHLCKLIADNTTILLET